MSMRQAFGTFVQRALRARGLELVRRVSVDEDRRRYAGYSERAVRERRFYNVGAGSFSHPAWTNVDYQSDWYRGAQASGMLHHDLTAEAPLPIETGEAELVYSSHTIEHVPDRAIARFFREGHRVLRPGGVLRITCPDADVLYGAYQRNDLAFFERELGLYARPGTYENQFTKPLTEASVAQLFLNAVASERSTLRPVGEHKLDDAALAALFAERPFEDALRELVAPCVFRPTHPQYHMNWWTVDKVMRCLREAGFEDVWRSAYGQSIAPPMRDVSKFDAVYWNMSLYVEARR